MIKFVRVLQFHKLGILRRECNALLSIYDIIIYLRVIVCKESHVLKFKRLRKRKILCTTIMLSIDGQFTLKEAVTFPVLIFIHGKISFDDVHSSSCFLQYSPCWIYILYNCCAQRKKRNKPNLSDFYLKKMYTRK